MNEFDRWFGDNGDITHRLNYESNVLGSKESLYENIYKKHIS